MQSDRWRSETGPASLGSTAKADLLLDVWCRTCRYQVNRYWCTNQLLGMRSAAIAVCQAMRCDTGMPSRVIRLSTEQATRASVFWLGRVRARRPRPMMVLYRNTAVSPNERLP